MSFSSPIQWYHSQADPFWPDGTFKPREICNRSKDDVLVIQRTDAAKCANMIREQSSVRPSHV
jgi:hypothetical protein